MISRRSYTRITLALDIVGRLEDGPYKGYHELGIVKHQIDLFDLIQVRESKENRIECSDSRVPLDDSNLCWRAAQLLQERCKIDSGVTITIEKHIPVMGGLAGGSANAATVLTMLNELWHLGLGLDELRHFGRRIGMDVPYYFTGGTAFDSETGGWPEAIPTALTFDFVLFMPPFGVSTVAAYQNIDYGQVGRMRDRTERMSQALCDNDKKGVIDAMHNDFELSVFRTQPKLREYAETLVAAGCSKVIMSGSGSTLLGVAADSDQAEEIAQRLGERALRVATISPADEAQELGKS